MLSFFKRKDSPPHASGVDEAAGVEVARTRARRRLIGAAVLLGVGIVGFPLLFETQPRPVAVDIPIEVTSRPASAALDKGVSKAGPTHAPRAAGTTGVERAAEAPVEPAPSAAAASQPGAAAVQQVEPAASAAQRADRANAAAAVAAPAAASRAAAPQADAEREAQRAQALLDGKPVAALSESAGASAAPTPAARFVVQAGAYTDAAALRDARQKVEKLGLKTYTQVVETDSGARTRVRVGPFATRDEAEKAAARIKGSGLAANIVSL